MGQQDRLILLIQHVADAAGGYYQVTMRGRQALLGGPFRRKDSIQPTAVYALQRHYDRLLEKLLAQAEAGVPVTSIDRHELFELSQRIGEILPRSVRTSLTQARLQAQDRRDGLQITLQVDTVSRPLLAIPWELTASPFNRDEPIAEGDEQFLLLDAHTSLVRQVRGIGHHRPPRVDRPLRFLGLAAAPDGVGRIDLNLVRAALCDSLGDETFTAVWYEGADTLGTLQRLLRERNPQVLHLLCHGEQTETGRGVRSDLLFTHADGFTQRVAAADLVPLLSLATDLQLVMLHACHVGAARALDPVEIARLTRARSASESLSLAFVRAGVPAVVAFQGPVRQQPAAEFMRAFYTELAAGASIEAAVAAGRLGAHRAGGIVDWSQAALYQGSGWPQQSAWHTRLADGLMGVLTANGLRQSLRAAVLAMALALLGAGFLHLVLPSASAQLDQTLRIVLTCWAGLGLVAPAIIAVATRSSGEHDDLPEAVRSEVRVGRYGGAYIGYALGGLAWLGALVVLWVVGPLVFLPLSMLPGLAYATMLTSLLLSYGSARSQAQSAAAIAPVTPGLYSGTTLLVILLGALIMLAAPLLLISLPPGLSSPAAVGLALALALLTAVLRG